ncbi:hypothetical protein dsx2_1877 [Desulfovibrio sp. X2]|nr:hypothetical protein dsx2_1877 [Desulfovibrio sp. X2]
MAAVPVRNREVREQSSPDGTILSYPAAVNPWFGRMARKFGLWDGKPLSRKLQLDSMGTTVWAWIDGSADVRELSRRLAAHYGVTGREAEASMTAFLRELGKRGILAFRPGEPMPEDPPENQGRT